MPTAGVCDQRVGATVRLLPTAGVCDQHVGLFLRLLPTAGVCDQHIRVLLRLLPTAGLCNRHVGAVFRLLPPQVYAISLRSQDFCSVKYRCMLSACRGVICAKIPPVCGYVVENFQYRSNDCGRNVNAFFSDVIETNRKDSIHAKLLAYQF